MLVHVGSRAASFAPVVKTHVCPCSMIAPEERQLPVLFAAAVAFDHLEFLFQTVAA